MKRQTVLRLQILVLIALLFALLIAHLKNAVAAKAGPKDWLIVYFLSYTIYFIPTIAAALLKSSRLFKAALINLALGFTVIGWIWALLLATKEAEPASTDGQPVEPTIMSDVTRDNPIVKNELPPLAFPVVMRWGGLHYTLSILATAIILWVSPEVVSIANNLHIMASRRLESLSLEVSPYRAELPISREEFYLATPYSALMEKTRSSLLYSQNDPDSFGPHDDVWAALSVDKSIGKIRFPGSSDEVGDLSTGLAYIKLFGDPAEEYRLLSRAMQYEGNEALDEGSFANWIEIAYEGVAQSHFARGEYFLGLNAVTEGLQRLRLRKIENFKGESQLLSIASRIAIAEAYLPGDRSAPEEVGNLARKGALLLKSEFSELSLLSQTEARIPTPLEHYARGVVRFRNSEFDLAVESFQTALAATSRPAAKDLARFMVVRSWFWKTRAAEFRRLNATGNEKSEGADASEEDDESVRLYRAIAKAFVAELKRAGVFRSLISEKPPRVPVPSLSGECTKGLLEMKRVASAIGQRHWLSQAMQYVEELERTVCKS